MSLATKARMAAVRAISKLGGAATLRVPARTYDETSSEATGVDTAHAIMAAGPLQEVRRYVDQGTATATTGTFYVQAHGLAVSPATGDRISFGGRTWPILQVETIGAQGSAAVYRCDVGEVVDG